MEKLSESRIRSRGGQSGDVKVNKALAERIRRDERRAERKREKEGARPEAGTEAVEEEEIKAKKSRLPDAGVGSLLSDPRFAEVFENPDFEVDTASREFGLLNPSSTAALNAVCPLP